MAKADSLISESDSYFTNTDDLFWKNQILHFKGRIYLHKKDYEQALNYYSEVLKLSKPEGYIHQTIKAMNNTSIIKEYQGLFPEALDLQFQILEMECSSYERAYSYSNIGRIYRILKDWEPTKEYNERSIELKKKNWLRKHYPL